MLKSLKIFMLGFIALSVTVVAAQASCSALVEEALLAVEEFCGELGRNEACYGNVDLSAESQPDATDFVFEEPGNVVDVADIVSLELSELDDSAGVWGVAVMSLQADIPNTLPGQNVTFILFGDVAIENAATNEQTPMQAFYLRTGLGTVACEEAPESGVLIQTPDGVDEVTFNVNGVDVSVGSTVLLETEDISEEQTDLIMSTVEGSLAVQFDDETYPAVEGTQIRLPLNNELLPTGRPDLPQAYDENRVAPLPIAPLPRPIGIAPPLPPENVNDLQTRIQNGEPPCGVDGLPPCENILPRLRDGGNLPPPEQWGQRFEAGVNCIIRPEETVNAEDLPPLIGETQSLPYCPPADRASRPDPTRAVANNELAFDGDEDGDGVLNADDACPLSAGTAEFSGCSNAPADTDGDGLVDALDFCPYRAGDAALRGCPDAPNDADGDGFPDALDVCPNNAGVAEFRGCPEDPRTFAGDGNVDCANFSDPDSTCPRDIDGDSIRNALDDCPNRPGTVENNGCPANNSGGTAPRVTVTPTPVDSDGDGFADSADRCPNYPGDINGCPPDSDGDGLYDPQDNCPNRAGTAANNGCPESSNQTTDSDGDGVADANDQCPNQFGSTNYSGCPPPDSDGDGIRDPQDNCPNVAGTAARNGCPAPTVAPVNPIVNPPNPTPNPNGDFDRDGILNGQDQCPQQAGTAANNGCP